VFKNKIKQKIPVPAIALAEIEAERSYNLSKQAYLEAGSLTYENKLILYG